MPYTNKQLFQAAREGDIELLKNYVETGGDINIRSSRGRTLLMVSMDTEDIHTELLVFLIEHGIELDGCINTEILENATALHMAIAYEDDDGNVFNALIKRDGLAINAKASQALSSLDPHHFADGSYGDLDNATPLHLAVIYGQRKNVRKLSRYFGVDLNATCELVSNKGALCAEWFKPSIQQPGFDMGNIQYEQAVWKLLPDGHEELGVGYAEEEGNWREGAGTIVHSTVLTRIKNVTALHLAAKMADKKIAETLAGAGINPDLRDACRRFAFEYARTAVKAIPLDYHALFFYKSRDAILSVCNKFEDLANYLSHFRRCFLQGRYDPSLTRRLRSEWRYFAPSRNKNPLVPWYSQQFSNGLRGVQHRTPDITDKSNRTLITAKVASLQVCIDSVGGLARLHNRSAIESRFGNPYTWQTVRQQGHDIRYKHNPVPGQIGNFFLKITDSTGDYDDILRIINSLTRLDPRIERGLACLILDHARRGRLRSIQEIKQNTGVQLNQVQHHQLLEICNLINFKEIVRRLPVGCLFNGGPVKVPFAITHIQALRLIAEGHLRMKDVFGKNARFGIMTGVKITSSAGGVANAERIAREVNALYEEKIMGGTELSSEDYHRLLQAGYGGEHDTDGDPYITTSSDADTEQELALQRRGRWQH